MILTLNVPQIPNSKEEHYKGIGISFFNEIEEILFGRKKATSIVHFVRERLNKEEQQDFAFLIKGIIRSLGGEFSANVSQIRIRENAKVPTHLQKIFKNFQVSSSARTTRQIPEAGITFPGETILGSILRRSHSDDE
jgi:hypothetical protein